MINQQSASRSTSSTKRSTTLFVSYVPTRPFAFNRQTTTATTKHTIHTTYISPNILLNQGKLPPNDVIAGRMLTAGFFHGYRLLTTFAWRSLTTGETMFPLVSFVEIPLPVFWHPHMPYKKSQTKRVSCVIEHLGMCSSFSYLYYLLENKSHVDFSELEDHPRGPGDAAARNAAV